MTAHLLGTFHITGKNVSKVYILKVLAGSFGLLHTNFGQRRVYSLTSRREINKKKNYKQKYIANIVQNASIVQEKKMARIVC